MANQRIIRGGGGRGGEAHRKSIRNRRETETNFSFSEPEISRAGIEKYVEDLIFYLPSTWNNKKDTRRTLRIRQLNDISACLLKSFTNIKSVRKLLLLWSLLKVLTNEKRGGLKVVSRIYSPTSWKPRSRPWITNNYFEIMSKLSKLPLKILVYVRTMDFKLFKILKKSSKSSKSKFFPALAK